MSAKEEYDATQAEIKGLINQIIGQVKRHGSDFQNERNPAANWGYVREINEVKKKLENLTEFLANSL